MFGKLTWSAIPFDQPIPLIASALMIIVVSAIVAWVLERVAHQRRSQTHWCHVLPVGERYAASRLR
jgi:hypothetical protein